MSASISITTTLPASHEVGRRLNARVLVEMRRFGKRYVRDWRSKWRGWRYAGRPRKAPRLVSQRAWRARAVPTNTGAVLVISNEARDWRHRRDSYVAFVHRAGTPANAVEWLKVREQQEKDLDAKFLAALLKAAEEGVGPKARRKIRGEPTETVVAAEVTI